MLLNLAFVVSLATPLLAFPRPQTGVTAAQGNIAPATRLNLGLEIVPDAGHPFRPPGFGDQRGPCPGMNTLANHGYIPRDGIASFAQIVDAVQKGFNMEFTLGSGIAAFTMLTRGNVLHDKLSIGGESKDVPPLPGKIDGTPGGFAKHNRFEGDVSLTRRDDAIGDNRRFQPDMFQELLGFQKKLHPNDTVVDLPVIAQYKQFRYDDSLNNNPKFSFPAARFFTAFGEASFVLNFFPSGDTGILDTRHMTSFFARETFPRNWFRRATPLDGAGVGTTSGQIAGPNPPAIGAKDANGIFIPEVLDSGPCATYNAFVAQVPAALVAPGVQPQIKANALQLLQIVKDGFGPGCPDAVPTGKRN